MNNMNNRLIGMIMALAFAGMATSARGGSLNAPASPTNAASAMFTLDDIYSVLDTRTTNVALRTGGFTEPTAGPTSGTMHTLNDIMALVTNRAPVPKTGQTNSYASYDDGWYSTNAGVIWPTPRFVTNAVAAYSNCVTDRLTRLMWVKNPSVSLDWTNAIAYCEALDGSSGRGGYTDWRLPNLPELQSLLDYSRSTPALPSGHPFIGIGADTYWWSSTTYQYNNDSAWRLKLDTAVNAIIAKTGVWRVWPVRGGGN